jgi:hypothetical protein
MPSGHANVETINQRVPLTAHMQSVLLRCAQAADHGKALPWSVRDLCLTAAEKNALRALRGRGLVQITPGDFLRPTEAGRAALAKVST